MAQVAAGKPVAIFVQGEYGIGKSSIAGFIQKVAEYEHGLHGIYAPLGAASSIEDVGAAILEATVRSGALNSRRSEIVREWLSKYIGQQSFFGVTLHVDALKKDAPAITSGILPFLREVRDRLQDTGVKGIFLVLDEINGITANSKFAHFIKGIVDTNALSREPLPLLLMLCGVEERRREMIRQHQPTDRIFDVVEIAPLSGSETKEFFQKAFASAQMTITEKALDLFATYSGGFPKIMHLIGDAAYWRDQDGQVDDQDAYGALLVAAEEVGSKFVDQQVYKELKSPDYRAILKVIGKSGLGMSFRRSDVVSGLTDAQKKKMGNFLQKMKKLGVIRSGENQGEYVFTGRMARLYIWLKSSEQNPAPH